MKKLFVMAAVLVASLSASAQMWVGGSFGFDWNNYAKSYGDKTQFDFNIAPEVGVVTGDAWSMGVRAAFGTTTNELGQKDNNETRWGINPFARYDFWSNGAITFCLEGGIGYESVKPKGGDNCQCQYIGVAPVFKFAASDKITLVARLGYLGYKNWNDSPVYSNQFGFGADGTKLSFGCYFSL